MHRRLTLSLALALALSACAVGPDPVAPELEAPGEFVRQEAGGAAPEAEFWRRFGDAQLTRLVDQALEANHDLRIALARYDRARALLRQSRFDQVPTITARGEAVDGRVSGQQRGLAEFPGVSRDAETYEASIDASWELDFFGRVRRSVAAARAEAEASAADLAVAQVTVVSELAATYFELRGAQERLRVARANAENQRDSLELVRVRLEHGRGTEFDTARARAQLESTLARIPALEAETAVAMHRIAVLTGRDTAAVVAELSQTQELPTVTQPISAGAPGDLLRRRPDVAAAERRLAAATARIGVATADLFPRFTLGGLIGTQAVDTADLFEGRSEQRLVMLGIDWSLLDVGRVRARIAAADADAAADLARYEQTVLRAIEETENALVRYARSRAERNHRAEAAQAGARAAGLARRRFEGGIVDFLEVLDAERSQLEAEDELAQSRTRSATALVALYRSLAGGWPDRTPGGA